MFEFIFRKERSKPPYLDRIDVLEKLDIVRLKGSIDHMMIPVVENRIKQNRQAGSKIDRNVLLDFTNVVHVDSAAIASHILHLKEYQEKGYTLGFLNVNKEFIALIEIFKEEKIFKIYHSEEVAVRELNR